MKINSNGGPIRPDIAGVNATRTQAPDKAKVDGVPAAANAVDRSDKVQISDSGRALAARDGATGALSAERVAEIRQKVLDGAYNSLQVVDEVAKRLLASNDL